ncbi:hypothetical protein ECO7815_10642, partial [Escherichia coli O55:H7 str. 3256-97]
FILTEGFHRQQGTGPFKSHISLLKIKKPPQRFMMVTG